MLTDGKIDSLDTHLEQFKLDNQTAQNAMQNLLREYGQLLEDYKELKKAFDTKGSKPLAIATAIPRLPAEGKKPRNPYVLVLVDGNGYIFNDELIREKEEGGMRAARMMNDAVEKYIHQSVPEAQASRVVVRVYADLTNLSKQLAKSKVTGLEKRSVAPFSAGFTRAMSLFDFVDSLDGEGAKFKIREQFKVASEDSSCTHILYAACHDSAYLSQLVAFSGLRDKVTLVQGAGWSPEFHQFNLNVTQFPTIFRWSDLPATIPNTKAAYTNGTAAPKPNSTPPKTATDAPTGARQYDTWASKIVSPRSPLTGSDAASVTTNGFDTNNGISLGTKPSSPHKPTPQPCKYFQKGYCRFGNNCTFQHLPRPLNTTTSPKNPSSTPLISTVLSPNPPPNSIPLNAQSHRIDPYIRPPMPSEWAIYNTRFAQQKPCNAFHLQDACSTLNCSYDHAPLEPEAKHVLTYVLKCNACPAKGACRKAVCVFGHVCQREGCTGQGKGCRMKAGAHGVDLRVVGVVEAEGGREGRVEIVGGENGGRW